MGFLEFFMGGGFSMWFVLLFGAFTLAAAIGFMRRLLTQLRDLKRRR